jgi:hypothetical protein
VRPSIRSSSPLLPPPPSPRRQQNIPRIRIIEEPDIARDMKWSTSVITTLSSDTEPAVMLTFNDGKYIFNTSENTMRRFLQSGQVWRRAKALFFTQARVEKMSGLPGALRTFLTSVAHFLTCMLFQRADHDICRCDDQ